MALEEAPGDGWPRSDAYIVDFVTQDPVPHGSETQDNVPQEPVPHGQALASIADVGALGHNSPIQRLAAHLDLSTVER